MHYLIRHAMFSSICNIKLVDMIPNLAQHVFSSLNIPGREQRPYLKSIQPSVVLTLSLLTYNTVGIV